MNEKILKYADVEKQTTKYRQNVLVCLLAFSAQQNQSKQTIYINFRRYENC
uniref:Uncharacterized protein n=1 Tax=Octopus bimaculoides TaxID=37653 RepID=A0A0L8HF58_OCTBM